MLSERPPRSPRAFPILATFCKRSPLRKEQVDGAATFTGAILGATYGISQLPQEEIRRLELGMIAESLCRDAVASTSDPYGSLHDQYWWNRYPGW